MKNLTLRQKQKILANFGEAQFPFMGIAREAQIKYCCCVIGFVARCYLHMRHEAAVAAQEDFQTLFGVYGGLSFEAELARDTNFEFSEDSIYNLRLLALAFWTTIPSRDYMPCPTQE